MTHATADPMADANRHQTCSVDGGRHLRSVSAPLARSPLAFIRGAANHRGGAALFILPALRIESDRVYSLAELIDLAEAHNPETRVAWEGARAQAAALGIARSELFPTLAAVALAGVDRHEAAFGLAVLSADHPGFSALR